MEFTSFAELEKTLNELVNLSLKNAEEDVKNIAKANAQEQIYSSYSPKRYKRRFSYINEYVYQWRVNGTEAKLYAVDIPPNPEGDPPPTVDKDLNMLIEEGGDVRQGEAIRHSKQMQSGYYNNKGDWVSYRFVWYEGGGQHYDYKGFGPRPYWQSTYMELAGGAMRDILKEELEGQGLTVK